MRIRSPASAIISFFPPKWSLEPSLRIKRFNPFFRVHRRLVHKADEHGALKEWQY